MPRAYNIDIYIKMQMERKLALKKFMEINLVIVFQLCYDSDIRYA